MFTGIIEELGSIRTIRMLADSAQLVVKAVTVLEGTKTGDSISVNGVCLTVTALTPQEFTADVMLETLQRSNLKDLKPRSPVNLERALTLQTRCGGHFVSGHIDGVGAILKISQVGIAKVFEISAPSGVAGMIVDKGSIAIDGISLTVVAAMPQSFTVSLIPHTLSHTTLTHKTVGSTVNLETDILGKYVARFIQGVPSSLAQESGTNDQKHSTLSPGFLREHGYL